MKPFLESLADYIVEYHRDTLGDLCFVFPNRRSGLFFKKHLSARITRTTWMPEITAINEFISGLSSLEPADPAEAIFLLHDVYKSMIPYPEPFDEFYYRGELMINDFDDIDKYLVDADQLFRNIYDLKEVEELFAGLEEDQLNFIRQFWRNFHSGEDTEEKKGFLKVWEMLPRLYAGLKSEMEKAGMGYEGMIYRQVAERSPEEVLGKIPHGKVIIAGFNALNHCEKKIFRLLKESGRADFFWDYDRRYISETYLEAGRFLRQNLELFSPPAQLENFDNLSEEKEIRIFDLPNDVLQAKTLTTLLNDLTGPDFQDPAETAVVLCDEELLVPVLMSLPDRVRDVNITMGYPFKNTTAYSFMDQLMVMQENLYSQSQGGFFYRDILAVVNHPFMRSLTGEQESGIAERIIKNNLVRLEEADIEGELEKMIFRKVRHIDGFYSYFMEVSERILSEISKGGDNLRNTLDREYIFQFITSLNRINRLLKGRGEFDINTCIRIFRKIISRLRIPFSGEPLAGLQVMGILETRLLDFSNLVLLSMNEDVMPRAHSGQSLVPYSLRAGYNMPTREDKDAIYAYYFYRLIQRAGHIDLLYNSNPEGARSGEMSRYLHQLKFEYDLTPVRPVVNISTFDNKEIIVPKDQAVMDRIGEFCEPGGGSYLSPSALNALIDCSLKYYFRYIAGIGEQLEVTETVDAIGFGNILHDTVKVLYEEVKDPLTHEISSSALQSLLKNGRPEAALDEVFKRIFFKGRKDVPLSGTNIVIFRVMLKYILKIIELDSSIAPFVIESLEKFCSRKIKIPGASGEQVARIGGRIDRIDRLPYPAGTPGTLRVIDYKSGAADLSIPSIESLYDGSARDRNRAGFQTLLYAWLVGEEYPGDMVTPGLYVMKHLFSEDFNPGFTIGRNTSKRPLRGFEEVSEEFLTGLKVLIGDLFNQDIPFSQTKNENTCKYCDYRQICRRTSFD